MRPTAQSTALPNAARAIIHTNVPPRPSADPIDPKLARLAATRKDSANELLETHRPWFEVQFRAATRKCCPSNANRLDFEETLRSEFFAKLQRVLSKWEDGNVKAYLSTAIRNEGRDLSRSMRALRRNAETVEIDEKESDSGPNPEAEFLANERAQAHARVLADALACLAAEGDVPLKWADTVHRICLLGETPQEQADRMGERRNTIDQWKKRGLERLAEILSERGHSMKDLL